MKILKIIVDELPKSCSCEDCGLGYNKYCTLKGAVSGQQWIGNNTDNGKGRAQGCPLELCIDKK